MGVGVPAMLDGATVALSVGVREGDVAVGADIGVGVNTGVSIREMPVGIGVRDVVSWLQPANESDRMSAVVVKNHRIPIVHLQFQLAA